MIQKKIFAGLVAGAMLAGASVSAATVSVLANAPASWAGVDQGATTALTAGANWTTAPSIVAGSLAGNYKSPFDPALANNGVDVVGGDVIVGWENLDYYTVGSPNLQGSPAVLTYGQDKTMLSLLWGSIDLWNAIELYLDGSAVATISGQDVFDNGGLPAASGAALVKITEAGGFDEVRFYSNFNSQSDTPAFEFSNVVAAVPLPAGGLLLIGALGGLAALRRRKKAA